MESRNSGDHELWNHEMRGSPVILMPFWFFWHPWQPWGLIHIDLNKNSVQSSCVINVVGIICPFFLVKIRQNLGGVCLPLLPWFRHSWKHNNCLTGNSFFMWEQNNSKVAINLFIINIFECPELWPCVGKVSKILIHETQFTDNSKLYKM